jgi:F420H(2)-dependent quinone reductase
MSSKPPPAFPPPGTLKAKLVNLIPRTNVAVYRWSKGRLGGKMQALPRTKRPASARIAASEEMDLYWPRLVAGYPFYNDYQARTAREIPVIVLSAYARQP